MVHLISESLPNKHYEAQYWVEKECDVQPWQLTSQLGEKVPWWREAWGLYNADKE